MNVDVTKIHDHVSHTRLLHNLKKKNIEINNLISQKLSKRTSIIDNFREKKNAINRINVEISQKSFILFILYLFFNANLLNICEQLKRKTIFIEFVDDVNVVTYNTNTKKNYITLKK